ncbi:recombinase RecT [Pseudaminobacter sp. NGMCC 1.201702]|uniref:recombinase RecT n=1 Tax=Pseudaminobacter sp. NGMCC 1.201702 TaxID=3391825 RepID=UPI0039EE0FCD
MNQIATRPETSINTIGIATGAGGSSIAPQNLGEVVRFAEVMCKADIALPKHLRGNAGACMAVALQALEWRMSPFAVASKSYSVNGQIAYEAQLIMAVINTRSGIEGRLKFRFEGEGGERVCIAYGKLDGEELEVRSPKFKDITPKNSPLWKSDPDQQHCYYTARAWGRRYTPEVILGVYDRDEVEQFRNSENARDVTPSLQERLRLAKIEQHDGSQHREGFDQSFVTRETAVLTGEPANDHTEDNSQTDDGSENVTQSSVGDPAADSSAPTGDEGEAGQIEAEDGPAASSVSPDLSDEQVLLLRIFRTMQDCVGPSVEDFNQAFKIFDADLADASETVKRKAETIRTSLEFCCGDNPKRTKLQARTYLAGVIGVDETGLD